jgi:N-acetylglucosamine kinase
MIAAGIDLGGTKIEAQVFDARWHRVASNRIATPATYDALVQAMAAQIAWATDQAGGQGGTIPIGICAAGLVNPATGLALTANLPASGRPFPADIAAAAGRPVTYINDCRAQALSEAMFGAARGFPTAMALNLGTGIAGGIVVDGRLLHSPSGTGGEFGHFPISAVPIVKHALPVLPCGCGRTGCSETLIAGPGLVRIAQLKTGRDLTAQAIASGRHDDPALAAVWAIWLELVTDLLITLTLTADPGCIVLAGGLAQIEGLLPEMTASLHAAQLAGYAIPTLRLAEGGDATGARGAAYAAWRGAGHG